MTWFACAHGEDSTLTGETPAVSWESFLISFKIRWCPRVFKWSKDPPVVCKCAQVWGSLTAHLLSSSPRFTGICLYDWLLSLSLELNGVRRPSHNSYLILGKACLPLWFGLVWFRDSLQKVLSDYLTDHCKVFCLDPSLLQPTLDKILCSSC